jgi:TM2 domain-containing membrane protein YozV
LQALIPILEESAYVQQNPAQALRDQLTLEQQGRFDAMYTARQKKTGTATALSLPLLGTFGLEHFYLGNPVRGVLSILFSWTLIPTFFALFEVISGDLKRQVDHANARLAKTVYDQVIKNTVTQQSPPSSAASAQPAPVAQAAPVVTETVVATVEPVTPAVSAVEETVTQTQTVDTSASFTATAGTSTWEAGMNAPATTSDSAGVAFQTSATTAETVSAADVSATPEPDVFYSATITSDEAGDTRSAAQIEAEAQPLADAGDAIAADGVLVFVDDGSTLTADTSVAAPVVASVTEEQAAVQATEVNVTEAAQATTQHYHDGKLVASTEAHAALSGEVNRLLTEQTRDTVSAGTAETHPAGWVDVSPLHDATGATASAELRANPIVPDGGANTPGGGIGDGGDTNTPGGDVGNPPDGTNQPGGGIGDPTTSGDPTVDGNSRQPGYGEIPS